MSFTTRRLWGNWERMLGWGWGQGSRLTVGKPYLLLSRNLEPRAGQVIPDK